MVMMLSISGGIRSFVRGKKKRSEKTSTERFKNVRLFCYQFGSFYTFDPHARNHDGMPNSNGTATVLKFGDLGELGTFLCYLANELKC